MAAPGLGGYLVSTLGNVRHEKSGRLLKPEVDHGGYLRVYGKRVHRLVAKAFIPNPGGLATVNHLNGAKTDNRAANLEWCSNAHNVRHAVLAGLYPQARLSYQEAEDIRTAHAFGATKRGLARQYGVDRNTISRILTNKSWARGTGGLGGPQE